MSTVIKHCVGIDVAKDDFVVSFGEMTIDQQVNHLSWRKFKNNESGFKAFNKWAGKFSKTSVPLTFVMEATGVYHERLAYFLQDLGRSVCIVLPKRAKDFTRTLKVKKIDDKIASESLSVMGLEKKLDLWKKPKAIYAELKHFTRERSRLQKQITQIKNHLEAEMQSAMPNKITISRMRESLKLFGKQEKEIMSDIKRLISSDEALNKKVKDITTIPHIGLITAATVIGETEGFNQINNKRQLVSYAGYDIINHESGTSVKTKPRISKRGNKHIRKAMHMPAISAIRREGKNKDLFVRLVSKSGIKMKGVVAVQRKLLVLMYTLWKNDSIYDQEYESKEKGCITQPEELELVRS